MIRRTLTSINRWLRAEELATRFAATTHRPELRFQGQNRFVTFTVRADAHLRRRGQIVGGACFQFSKAFRIVRREAFERLTGRQNID
jgi:hypothetical protein